MIFFGLGLKPNLTGKGYGMDFYKIIENYIYKTYSGVQRIDLMVAKFNLRACTLYKKCGFVEYAQVDVSTNGGVFPFICMNKDI